MGDRKNDVLDVDKVNEGIEAVMRAFSDLGLTVAECIKVMAAVEAAFKAKYPQGHERVAR